MSHPKVLEIVENFKKNYKGKPTSFTFADVNSDNDDFILLLRSEIRKELPDVPTIIEVHEEDGLKFCTFILGRMELSEIKQRYEHENIKIMVEEKP